MTNIEVDGLTFTFPDSWKVSKYDDWAFYRNQFSKIKNGIKAVDLLAIENQVTWLIEVKDYRTSRREKTVDCGLCYTLSNHSNTQHYFRVPLTLQTYN